MSSMTFPHITVVFKMAVLTWKMLNASSVLQIMYKPKFGSFRKTPFALICFIILPHVAVLSARPFLQTAEASLCQLQAFQTIQNIWELSLTA